MRSEDTERKGQDRNISKESAGFWFCVVNLAAPPVRNVMGKGRLYILPTVYSVLRGDHRATCLPTDKGSGPMTGHHHPVISVWSTV